MISLSLITAGRNDFERPLASLQRARCRFWGKLRPRPIGPACPFCPRKQTLSAYAQVRLVP